MKNWNGLFWGIPAIALYFYSATVLTEYGYTSYFNIPSSFISASLSDNIIYFFQLFTVGKYEMGLMRWWAWIIVLFALVFILFLYYSHDFWRVLISVVGTVVFLLVLGGFYDFGKVVAASDATFWVTSASCPPIGSDARYVVPTSFGGQAVFIPIDQGNKMTGGFFVKNLADLPCKLEQRNIGKVTN
jgi:hypothetical protein